MFTIELKGYPLNILIVSLALRLDKEHISFYFICLMPFCVFFSRGTDQSTHLSPVELQRSHQSDVRVNPSTKSDVLIINNNIINNI